MKKEIILNALYEKLNQLTPAEYAILKKQLVDYEKSQKFANSEDLARGIIKDLPYMPMLHDSAVRDYLEKIATNTSVIKVILVIYFVCSIICGIVILSHYGK